MHVTEATISAKVITISAEEISDALQDASAYVKNIKRTPFRINYRTDGGFHYLDLWFLESIADPDTDDLSQTELTYLAKHISDIT